MEGDMNIYYELFRNKPQEIIAKELYYELGELDFNRLKKLANNCPMVQRVVEKSIMVGPKLNPFYFLVPVDLVLEASGTAH
jgi:hypothetical protein